MGPRAGTPDEAADTPLRAAMAAQTKHSHWTQTPKAHAVKEL
jgi:hypothetical protein